VTEAEQIVDAIIATGEVPRLEANYYGRRKDRADLEAQGLSQVHDLYMKAVAGVVPGSKVRGLGQLAAYTHDWPEFDHWTDYSRVQFTDDATDADRRRFARVPVEDWSKSFDGCIHYTGRGLRVKGHGVYNWKMEVYHDKVLITLENWNRKRDRLMTSHWIQPVMYDTKRRTPQEEKDYPLRSQHWADLHPDYFDTEPLDEKIKDKLVAEAKDLLDRLGKLVQLPPVRWNVAGLYVAEAVTEAKPTWGNEGKNVVSDQGYEQVGGDFGDPWTYGGTWYKAEDGCIVHFDGLEGQGEEDIEGTDKGIDDKLQEVHYKQIAAALSLDHLDRWENVEDEIRDGIAERLNENRAFQVYRTCDESPETIESDWSSIIPHVKSSTGMSDEDWASMPTYAKLEAIADYSGWLEMDHQPDRYTKAELSVYLGIDL
jgi:hypothetical protein